MFSTRVPLLPSATDATPAVTAASGAASDQCDAEIEITVMRMSPPPLGAGSRPEMQAVKPDRNRRRPETVRQEHTVLGELDVRLVDPRRQRGALAVEGQDQRVLRRRGRCGDEHLGAERRCSPSAGCCPEPDRRSTPAPPFGLVTTVPNGADGVGVSFVITVPPSGGSVADAVASTKTWYATVSVVSRPSTSVAVTDRKWKPNVVLIGSPTGTDPSHDATAAPPGAGEQK